jgi:hypothetical protein
MLRSLDLAATREELWKGFSVSRLGAPKKAREPRYCFAAGMPAK